jgi:hypothetical protein
MPDPITSSDASPGPFLSVNSSPKPLIHIPTTSDLGSLNSTHLADPRSRGLDLAHSTDLIAGIAGDADVITTLEGELDIANLQDLGAPFLCVLACCLQDLVDKLICNGKDRLRLD